MTQYWRVMDRQTDRHLVTAYSALCIASCGKNCACPSTCGSVTKLQNCHYSVNRKITFIFFVSSSLNENFNIDDGMLNLHD